MRKTLALAVLALQLTGCNTAATRDQNSFAFVVPRGSKLVLNKPVQIPTQKSHLLFQDGRIVGGVDQYRTSCRFDVYDLGPSMVEADSFLISRAYVGEEWAIEPTVLRFYRTLHLKSGTQKDVWKLTCEHWDNALGGRAVSIPQMREALGDYFSFEFAHSP